MRSPIAEQIRKWLKDSTPNEGIEVSQSRLESIAQELESQIESITQLQAELSEMHLRRSA